MNNFSPSFFFDLNDFEHKELFQEKEAVWNALKKIKKYLQSVSLGKIEGTVQQGAHLINPETISIGPGTIVESGAYIIGPCIIGKDCQIRHGAYIRGSVITGNECVIGHTTEIKNSILLHKAQAGHFAYIGDSILGSHTNLGAGTKCANLRFDGKTIRIQNIDTALRKFGLILGDGGQTGCNCVTNPGTIMGKKAICYPCLNIGGIILENTIIKTTTPVLTS